MATTPKRTDIDTEKFRKLLLEERNRLRELHRQQTADVREEMADGSENELSRVSTFDSAENEDTAVMLTEWDRENVLDENARQVLYQIDHALDRMDQGLYGICEITGADIPTERLKAIPWATMTVAAAAEHEK